MDRAGARGDPGIDGTRIGLFGGSFDPPHIGHRELVRAALDRLPLARLWVVPAGRPVHRRLSGCASADQRLAWLARMFDDWPAVEVQDWEVRADHPVPTIETLRRVHAAQPGATPVLLLGADAFAGMRDWVDYPAHARLCDVAVFARAGVALSRLPEWREVPADELARPGVGRVTFVRVRLPDVSATGLRERAARGESLVGLVPECLREDIERAYLAGCGRAMEG